MKERHHSIRRLGIIPAIVCKSQLSLSYVFQPFNKPVKMKYFWLVLFAALMDETQDDLQFRLTVYNAAQFYRFIHEMAGT